MDTITSWIIQYMKNIYEKPAKERQYKRRINEEDTKYGKRADIRERIEINGKSNCFITLKDHKENFVNEIPLKTKS